MFFLPDVSRRHLQPELMDQAELEARHHLHALRGLARINFWSGSVRLFWPALCELAHRTKPRPLRILDIATGAGDVPLRLWRKARRAGWSFQIDGWDISPRAVEYARSRAGRAGADIGFQRHDALAETIPPGYDAIISSLFLHHLDEEAAIRLLRNMGQAAGQLVLINDLERRLLGWLLARLGTRLLSTSSIVHVDGPRSVEGAFTPDEALRLAGHAGLHGATVTRHWPARFLLAWRRS